MLKLKGYCLRGTDLNPSPRNNFVVIRDIGDRINPVRGSSRRCSGMTLLELVIAIAIFSLVVAAAYAALSQGLVVQDRLQEQRRFWQRFETVFNLLHTDLDQAVDLAPRGISRNGFDGYEYGNSGGFGKVLEFTRRVNADFHAGPASPFLRVGYRLDDGGLYRRTWARPDQPYETGAVDNLLIEGVSEVRLRYLASADLWLARWPQPVNTEEPPGLPRAVEIIIELEDGGAYRWVFHVGPSS